MKAEVQRESYDFLDFCLIKDETDYQILPHTDQEHNVFTLLFYCPVLTESSDFLL